MKQFGRALTLALLSALTAEFLLGDQWLSGAAPLSQQAAELVLFTVFYGSAAVLIREFVRRTGRGWPSILLLAFAFGVIEEGIVDQSLFNPDFAGAHLLAAGLIPALGIGGPWTIFVLTLHVIWSIGSPIAIVEALFPSAVRKRRATAPQTQAPWLGVPGSIVAGALYLVGGTAIFAASTLGSGFMASPLQMGASLAVAAGAIVIGLRLRPRTPRAPRRLWIAVPVALVFTSGFMLLKDAGNLNPWLTCAALLAVLTVGTIVASRLRLDPLGLAAGAILTYGWVGFFTAATIGSGAALEQAILIAFVLAAVAAGFIVRFRHERVGSNQPAGKSLRGRMLAG